MLDEHYGYTQEANYYIGELPDEVLGTIFLFNSFKRFYDGTEAYDAYSTTQTIIQVCKRWYLVALSYPALWANVIDYQRHPPSRIKELLIRSKQTPLDIGECSAFRQIHLRQSYAMTVLQHIFAESSRIRTLSLQIRIKPWNYICTSFLTKPAPQLEYLNLITACPFPDCLYPGPLFANSAPRLRRVHLRRCLVDFSSPVLFNLTELSVADILGPGILAMRQTDHPLKKAPTVAGWLDLLKNTPSLIYLTLDNAISISPDDETKSATRLSKLAFLTIGADRSQEGSAFLQFLLVPDGCSVRLRLGCRDASPATVTTARIFAFLRNQLTHWSENASNRYLQAKILSGSRIHFGNTKRAGYLWDRTESSIVEDHFRTSNDPLIWLVISLETPEDAVQLFNQLLTLYTPTYPTTTTLDLWIDEEFTRMFSLSRIGVSPDMLHSFATLQTLNLLERSPLRLLPLLQTTSLPNMLFLPKLRTLQLTRTVFDEQEGEGYVAVTDFLNYRSENLSPLSNLHIVDGTINGEELDFLIRIGGVKVTFETSRHRPLAG